MINKAQFGAIIKDLELKLSPMMHKQYVDVNFKFVDRVRKPCCLPQHGVPFAFVSALTSAERVLVRMGSVSYQLFLCALSLSRLAYSSPGTPLDSSLIVACSAAVST